MPDGHAPESTALTSRPCEGCGAPFAPTRPAQRFCCDGCRWRSHQRAREATPEGKAAAAKRSADSVERHHAWHCWRSRLRGTPLDTPERRAVLESLRGRGRVPPDEVRAMLAAAGCPVPFGRRAEAPAAPAVEAPAPTPPEPDRAPLTGRWALPSPEAPRLMPCAALDLATVSEVSAEGTRGRMPVRFLHGALTAVHGASHSAERPRWRLAPQSHRHHLVLLHDARDAERLRGSTHERRLGPRVEALRFGAMVHRPRFPAALAAGVYRVRVDVGAAHVATLEPERDYDPRFDVVTFVRNGNTEATTEPGVASMTAVATRLLTLAGIAHDRGVEVRDVESFTRDLFVRVGGHVSRGACEAGVVHGFDGRVTVVCNAVAAWGLKLAEVYGLGGLTAFGLGGCRVSVEVLT